MAGEVAAAGGAVDVGVVLMDGMFGIVSMYEMDLGWLRLYEIDLICSRSTR